MTTIWQFLRSLVHNSHGANLATIAPNRFLADEDQAYSDVTGINTVVKTLSKWLVHDLCSSRHSDENGVFMLCSNKSWRLLAPIFILILTLEVLSYTFLYLLS